MKFSIKPVGLSSLLVLLFYNAFPQEKPARLPLKTACDCNNAIPLNISKSFHYGPTQAPVSYGNIQEITSSDKFSETSFSEEHNSAWYLLNIKFDGQLEFEIIPEDTANDYDFLLYPYKDSGICKKILNKSVIPVRSNISNNTYRKNNGTTGLSVNATQAFHSQGTGDPYSLPVTVKKGDKYMLVLDNVTPQGKGHSIYFHHLKTVEIKGIVLNEDSIPVRADIKLADPQGKTVAQGATDARGAYNIKAGIEENLNYSLTISNDSSFVGTRTINTAALKEGNSFPSIITQLPKLKKGAKYPLGNINFYGGSPSLLPVSIPSVEALSHLMDKNKKMIIQIEGHVNAPLSGPYSMREDFPGSLQDLSEERAETVQEYLINKGIKSERIRTIGLAGSQMLFPRPKDEIEASANRRVEIKVISIRGE